MTCPSEAEQSAAALLRAVIITEISQRPRTTLALAELAGLEWCDKSRRLVIKAIKALQDEGYIIVNLNPEGSHAGGLFVMTYDPEYGHVTVVLPRIRCGTPGCPTYLAQDNMLRGKRFCSACQTRQLPQRLHDRLGELTGDIAVELLGLPRGDEIMSLMEEAI